MRNVMMSVPFNCALQRMQTFLLRGHPQVNQQGRRWTKSPGLVCASRSKARRVSTAICNVTTWCRCFFSLTTNYSDPPLKKQSFFSMKLFLQHSLTYNMNIIDTHIYITLLYSYKSEHNRWESSASEAACDTHSFWRKRASCWRASWQSGGSWAAEGRWGRSCSRLPAGGRAGTWRWGDAAGWSGCAGTPSCRRFYIWRVEVFLRRPPHTATSAHRHTQQWQLRAPTGQSNVLYWLGPYVFLAIIINHSLVKIYCLGTNKHN